MQIRQVHFEAFKSLYDLTCGLDNFTVLTGPNGSGKSNFVDALNFLGEVYDDGLEFAVGRGGGYDNIAHRRTRRAKRPITVELHASLLAEDARRGLEMFPIFESGKSVDIPHNLNLTYAHRFTLGVTSAKALSDFEVRTESIRITDSNGRPVLDIDRRSGRISATPHQARAKIGSLYRDLLAPFYDPKMVELFTERTLSNTALLTDRLFFSPTLGLVKESIGGTRVFQLNPYQCRSSGVSTPNATLARHGDNLPGAADFLRKNDAPAWGRVVATMRSILPDLIAIEIAYTDDRRLALQFRERSVGRPWNTSEVSDGTVQMLALLIALFDRRAPVLIVEEPENSVHPWILRQFVDLCREVAGKQIVLTTHSPVLLNYVRPESVRLMSMYKGRTRVDRLVDVSPEIREIVLRGDLSLFDAYDSGLVSAAVPQGLAQGVVYPDDDEFDDLVEPGESEEYNR